VRATLLGPTIALLTVLGALPVAGAPAWVPGRVIVKFRPEQRLPAATLFAERRSFAGHTGSGHLDALLTRQRVQGVRALLARAGKGGDVPEAAWAARRERARQRHPRRAARAPDAGRVPDLSRVYVVDLPPDADVPAAAAAWAADPSVEYAEPDHLYAPTFTPDDPFFASSGSWGQPFADLWGLHAIDASSAWDTAAGDGVVVAVIDTGLAVDHPDIQANVWTNPGEIAGNGIDDDGNDVVDDVHGWWALLPTQPGPAGFDAFGHGTHVAGIAGA
jgi:subtilisin family serine protease